MCRPSGEGQSAASVNRDQQPRQMDAIILLTFASLRSMAGLVPTSGPFWGPFPTASEESAVPSELVPGASPFTGLVDMVEWWEPTPPPRANATVVERPTQRARQRTESFFMVRLPRSRYNARAGCWFVPKLNLFGKVVSAWRGPPSNGVDLASSFSSDYWSRISKELTNFSAASCSPPTLNT